MSIPKANRTYDSNANRVICFQHLQIDFGFVARKNKNKKRFN